MDEAGTEGPADGARSGGSAPQVAADRLDEGALVGGIQVIEVAGEDEPPPIQDGRHGLPGAWPPRGRG